MPKTTFHLKTKIFNLSFSIQNTTLLYQNICKLSKKIEYKYA